MTSIGTGQQTYTWINDWAQLPDSPSARHGWAHPGMATSATNQIITCHPGEPTILVFDQDGRLLSSIATDLTECHSINYVVEDDTAYLWIADPGSKRRQRSGYENLPGGPGGRVVKLTMAGELVQELDLPPLAVYEQGKYSPTAVTINEKRHGGNGDIWVADGYGQNLVHRYTAEGRLPGQPQRL